MNKADFTRGIAILMAAYPEYQCSPQTVEVYRQELQEYPAKDFEAAIKKHIRENKWFPKICELRIQLEELRPKLPPAPLRIITAENAHIFADPNCPFCGGTGKLGNKEIKVLDHKIKGTMRCVCVKT